MIEVTKHQGFVCVLGKSNVGKSTIINSLIGSKKVITSKQAQTTRISIETTLEDDYCYIKLIDTPGILYKTTNLLETMGNKSAISWINSANVILFVVDAKRWNDNDDKINAMLKNIDVPIIVAINKVDYVKNKLRLLPYISRIQGLVNCNEIIPISALKNINMLELKNIICKHLPKGKEHELAGLTTPKDNQAFIITELVREKIYRNIQQEIPRLTNVNIIKMENESDLCKIYVEIIVDNINHKKILIGSKGAMLKVIGQQARLEIEELLKTKVYLNLWVDIKENWVNDQQILRDHNIINSEF